MAQVSGTFPQLTEPRRRRGGAMKATVSPAKAAKILKDGSVRGHTLTPAQRRFFGAQKSAGLTRKASPHGAAPARRVPGGLAAHRAMSRALTKRKG